MKSISFGTIQFNSRYCAILSFLLLSQMSILNEAYHFMQTLYSFIIFFCVPFFNYSLQYFMIGNINELNAKNDVCWMHCVFVCIFLVKLSSLSCILFFTEHYSNENSVNFDRKISSEMVLLSNSKYFVHHHHRIIL